MSVATERTAPWDEPSVARVLAAALEEDLGRGDITTDAIVPAGRRAVARLVAKSELTVAGLPLVPRLYALLGEVAVEPRVAEGAGLVAGSLVLEARGEGRVLLRGERTILNLLQHLSGIATLTRRCVEAARGSGAVVRDTRKTLPGLRILEKYAVRMGGGTNHRARLDDGVLIKENHIALAGGMRAAIEAARGSRAAAEIEVECRSLAEVSEALAAGAELILLDNMDAGEMTRAVAMCRGRARTEASGGITPERVRETAALGVDFIAMGCLTHSAPAVDLSMYIEPAAA
jgi:nicotinate-nucleotide pyrophosphorylase (carboxylating)